MTRAIAVFTLLLAGCVEPVATSRNDSEQDQESGSRTNEAFEQELQRQVEDNWALDPRTVGLKDMIVEIDVAMNSDGSVQSARIDPSNDNGNPNWVEFAQSCLRAVLKSSPLKMPPGKPYDEWKTITFVFYGRDMARAL